MILLILALLGVSQDLNDCPAESSCALGKQWLAELSVVDRQLKSANTTLVSILTEKKERVSVEPERTIAAIVAIQDQWPSIRNTDCELDGSLENAASPMQSAYSVACRIDWTKRRIAIVKAIAACLQKPVPISRDPYPLGTCLVRFEISAGSRQN